MTRAKFREFLGALSLISPLLANAQSVPPEVQAVRNYLLANDYPEVFSDKRYPVKIENVIADLDGDGISEVIAHVKPHFRQSPTIIIFKVGKDLHVQRVMEGLAPGPLQSVSGNYLDSHTLGEGMDFQAKMKLGYNVENGLVQGLVRSQKGNLILYKNFLLTLTCVKQTCLQTLIPAATSNFPTSSKWRSLHDSPATAATSLLHMSA